MKEHNLSAVAQKLNARELSEQELQSISGGHEHAGHFWPYPFPWRYGYGYGYYGVPWWFYRRRFFGDIF